jgi:hypothetical protein
MELVSIVIRFCNLGRLASAGLGGPRRRIIKEGLVLGQHKPGELGGVPHGEPGSLATGGNKRNVHKSRISQELFAHASSQTSERRILTTKRGDSTTDHTDDTDGKKKELGNRGFHPCIFLSVTSV